MSDTIILLDMVTSSMTSQRDFENSHTLAQDKDLASRVIILYMYIIVNWNWEQIVKFESK